MGIMFLFTLCIVVLFSLVSIVIGIFFIDIAFLLLVILVLIAEIEGILERKKIMGGCRKIEENLNSVCFWLQENHKHNQAVEARNEKRFFRIGEQKTGMYKKIDDNYDSLAKKIIQVENKLNEISRVFLLKEKVRSGKGKK